MGETRGSGKTTYRNLWIKLSKRNFDCKSTHVVYILEMVALTF